MTQVREARTLLRAVQGDLDSGGNWRGPLMFRAKISGIRRWVVPCVEGAMGMMTWEGLAFWGLGLGRPCVGFCTSRQSGGVAGHC